MKRSELRKIVEDAYVDLSKSKIYSRIGNFTKSKNDKHNKG